MPDLCCPYTIAGMTINPETGDGLHSGPNGITGLDGKPIRATVDNKGVTDGGLVHGKFWAPRIITFTGPLIVRSVPLKPSPALYAAVNAVEDAWIAALEGILNTPSALAWTKNGGSAKSIQVTYGIDGGHIEFGGSMLEPTYHFVLIAEDPDIT